MEIYKRFCARKLIKNTYEYPQENKRRYCDHGKRLECYTNKYSENKNDLEINMAAEM